MIWLPQGFPAREGENSWDVKGDVCIPPINTASAQDWGDMTQTKRTPACPFPPLSSTHVLWIPLPLPTFLHLSLEQFCCIDTPAILTFLLLTQSNFVIIVERKEREKKVELVYHNLYSTSCIFGVLLMLFEKNYSGLGQTTSAVMGSPYKVKDNWKEVKSYRQCCGVSLTENVHWVLEVLIKINLAGEWVFCKWVTGQGEESKHNSAKMSPTRHQDPQSSLLTYPYLTHEQCSGFCPTSGPHHMRLCQWLRSTKHWDTVQEGGAPGTWHLIEFYYTGEICATCYSHLQPILQPETEGLTHWGNKNTTKMWSWSCPRDNTGSQTQYF